MAMNKDHANELEAMRQMMSQISSAMGNQELLSKHKPAGVDPTKTDPMTGQVVVTAKNPSDLEKGLDEAKTVLSGLPGPVDKHEALHDMGSDSMADDHFSGLEGDDLKAAIKKRLLRR